MRSIADLVFLVAAFLVTYGPQALDGVVSRIAGSGPRQVARTGANMHRLLGSRAGSAGWETEAREYNQKRIENQIARVRELHRRGWSVDLSIEGMEHVASASANGNGVILWRMNFCSSHILKRAFHEAGTPVIHLSTQSHGDRFRTWLGRRVFAPIYVKPELKYLKERINIGQRGDLDYLRQLVKRLNRNDVVSIFGALAGRADRTVPVLGRPQRFAAGAPALARRTGAPLLPAYTRRVRRGEYEIVIRPPISVDRPLPRGKYIDKAVQEFASELEQAIRTYPESWNEWNTIR